MGFFAPLRASEAGDDVRSQRLPRAWRLVSHSSKEIHDMADTRTIAVIGATGAQGGGLVRAILNDAASGFSVRALPRNVNSDKAKALAELGAEVVAADVDDVESLKPEFPMMGIHLTQVTPRCRILGNGRLSPESGRVRGAFRQRAGLSGVSVSAPLAGGFSLSPMRA